MEQADGISLENLVRLGTPMMHPNQLLDIMHNLNRTQLIMSAIFDLLTSQCDRHAQVGDVDTDSTFAIGSTSTRAGRLFCLKLVWGHLAAAHDNSLGLFMSAYLLPIALWLHLFTLRSLPICNVRCL
jgi:hypothetical protein